MSLWQVYPIIGVSTPPSTQCNGIDISPIDTYVDYSNDGTVANLLLEAESHITAEGWFYIAPNHPGVPPGQSWRQSDFNQPLYRKKDDNHSGWWMTAMYRGHDAGNPYDGPWPWFEFGVVYHNPYRMMLELPLPPTSEYTYCVYQAKYAVSGDDQVDLSGWHHLAVQSRTWLDYGDVYGGEGNFVNNVADFWVDGYWINDFRTLQRDRFYGLTWDDASIPMTCGTYTWVDYERYCKLQWMRLSNVLRYTSGVDFTPEARCEPPDVDGNTLGLWPDNEGGTPPLTHLDNAQGYSPLDGTIINP